MFRFLADACTFLDDRYRAHGPVFRTRLAVPVVFAAGPVANQAIHITERHKVSYGKGYAPLAVSRLFERSLLLLDGAEHKHDRDILQPAVGRLALTQSLERIQRPWQNAADRLATAPETDVYELTREVTFEVSANALVGLDLDDLASWREPFETLIAGTMANTKLRFPFGKLDRGLKARAHLLTRLAPFIERARTREPVGMLGLLAHHKEPDGTPLTTQRIAEHLLLLFFAGYDTTAGTGAWALAHLAMAPEWQDRLVAEQRRVLGERSMRVEDTEALVEHGWFLKEVERCCPTVLQFPRRVVEDMVIHGFHIPAGTMLFWSPWLSHRIPEVFESPERFDPDRWDPARKERQAPSTALVGFGGGPRICIGKAFALVQLRVMLATLLRRYRIEMVNGPHFARQTLPLYRPKDLRLRFTPRS